MGDDGDHALGALLAAGAQAGHAGDGHVAGVGQALQEGDPRLEDLLLQGENGQASLLGGGHVHFRPPRADGADGVHDHLHGLLLLGEV